MEKLIDRLQVVDCFLFDMDGTLYLEGKAINGAQEVIDKLRALGKKIIFLSNNSSVSTAYYFKKLSALGFAVKFEDIYTSLDATIDYLNDNFKGAKVYFVGTESATMQLKERNITLTETNPDIVALSYDKELTYQKLILATRYITRGAFYLATHPDINCPAENVYQPDIGSFIQLIKASTSKLPNIIIGKPYDTIAKYIIKKANCPNDKIVMVGDRLSTDMVFAKNNGFKSALVLSGETDLEMSKNFDSAIDVTLNSVVDMFEKI